MSETLTRRERQCVELAAAGLSDKEIRKRLGMGSERTVQGHLAKAYAKLAVNDRRGAARALGLQHPGDLYPELPLRVPDRPAPAPHPGVSEAAEGFEGGGGAPGSLYDRYAALGRWRQPPRWWGGRSLLILLVAFVIVLGLGGAMALLRVVFEVFEIGQRWLR